MIRLFNWLRRGSLERGLDRELQYHYDRRVLDLTSAGLPESDARRRVAVELGLVQVREEVRDVWLTRWLRDFLYDLRFSLRSLLRTPGFTAATLLSLALGIGATTAIYSLVDQVILHALPVRDPGRLVLVDWAGDHVVGGFGSFNLMPYPLCRDLQQQTGVFDGVLCRSDEVPVNLSAGGDPKPVSAELVSGSYFSVLGVGPALGRVIQPEDDAAPGASPVVVLSHDFWQAQFGGAHDIVGRKVLINQHPMTVIGVAAPEFHGVDAAGVPALWLPASMFAQAIPGIYDDRLLQSPTRWMQILGSLRPGVTLEQAQSGLQPWFHSWLDENTRRPGFPAITADRRRRYFASALHLMPAPQGYSPLRRTLSEPLWVLFAATAVLLGLACLNVAGLFLARGSARTREIQTRLALGASRSRIGRQLLTETVLLAVAGGALGIALAPPVVRALLAFLPGNYADAHVLRSTINVQLLAFAFLASLVAGLLSGIAPALHSGRDSLISSLRERAGTALSGVRLRKCIVTLQVSFSLILVTGAALFVRTLTHLVAKGPGFDTSRLVTFSLTPLKNGYSRADSARLIRRIDGDIRALPITQSSAVARFPLLTGGSWSNPLTIQAGRRIVTDHDVRENAVSPGFFATLGVRIVSGRNFDNRDARPAGEAGRRRSAVVNQAFARRYLPGVDPLGILVGEGSGPDVKTETAIIGVVADFSYRDIREDSEQIYFPRFEGDDYGGPFYVNVRGTSEQAFESIRQIVRDTDPQLPILSFRPVDEQVNRSLNTERMLAALSVGFGALALLLSLIGLYGVMSFVVTRRTREIGIRVALGATAGSAIRLILGDAIAMIVAGVAIALPCVALLGRLVQSQLFGLTATDPAVVGGAALILAAGTLAAAFIPAWRASKVSPTEALRLE
jgi:predicted permease